MNRPEDHLLRGPIAREITLLEASAGTGKTYTISHRVLRLLLEERMELPRILVVTFTRAATRELKDRIRRVIVEARDVLERSLAGEVVADPPPALERVLRRDADAQREALLRVRRALDAMDLAAIFTIHGFCERALSMNALELGYDTAAELTASIDAALRAVAEDLYVERIAKASPHEQAFLQRIGYRPSTLVALGRKVWTLRDARLVTERPDLTLDEWLARVAACAAELAESAADVASALAPKLAKYGNVKDEAKKRANIEAACVAASELLAHDPHVLGKTTPPTPLKNLLPEFLAPWTHEGAVLDLPLLHALASLRRAQDAVESAPFRDFALALPARLEAELERRGELGFDQLIAKIHGVVRDPEGRARLRRTLGVRFDAALIDEFQDTDEAQWAIFRALFGEGKVFDLVGDPKQAIYGFRGADVHAYTEARKEAVAQATMAVNRRSDADYVEAMNVFFGLRPDAALATAKTLGSHDIEYVGVRAWEKHREPRLWGRPPLSLVRITEDAGEHVLPALVAEAIVSLLSGEARIRDDVDAPLRRLRPGDVAVLVRRGRIGQRIAEELRRRGVPCVTSKSENIWTSEAARLLDGLLTAALDPHDRRALHLVCADRLFDLPASEIDADALGRVSHVARLVREVRRLLESHGVAAAVVSLLAAPHGEGSDSVAAHLLRYQRGERLVTDLRHLAESLHLEAVEENLGGLELLERLRERRTSEEGEDQESQQRLETDADSVILSTIHASKGLEYPVVFLPDLDAFTFRNELAIDFHDDEGRRCLDVTVSREKGEVAQRAALERRQEELRLLYVAFTRARCHTTAYFRLPREKWPNHIMQGQVALSPLGAILFGEGEGEARLHAAEEAVAAAKEAPALDALAAHVTALVDRAGGRIALELAAPPAGLRYRPGTGEDALEPPLPYAGPEALDYGFSDYSYSGLVNSIEHEGEGRGGADEGDAPEETLAAPASPGEAVPLASLEMGANVGTFAHAVFEHLDFVTCAPKSGVGTAFELALEHAEREGLESPTAAAELFAGALPGILSTPLGGELGALSLSQIPVGDRLDEVDFHLPIDPEGRGWVKARDAAAALGRPTEGLEDKAIRGYVMGSIDLVFRVGHGEGARYFVADYKSNALGPHLDDYLPAKLAQAVDSHRYWLQAAFYLLALDRFLASRLGDAYDYDTHCGGALYLFFRGMVGEKSRVDDAHVRGVHLIRPSGDEMRALRAVLLGGGR